MSPGGAVAVGGATAGIGVAGEGVVTGGGAGEGRDGATATGGEADAGVALRGGYFSSTGELGRPTNPFRDAGRALPRRGAGAVDRARRGLALRRLVRAMSKARTRSLT